MCHTPLLLLAWMLPALAFAQEAYVDLRIEGMDCIGCQGKLDGALEALPFVRKARSSFEGGGACVALSGPADEGALRSTVEGLGYKVAAIAASGDCLSDEAPAGKDPWSGVTDVDVRVVSTGEEVDLEAALVKGRFTVIDFGAPWCGPCHEAAKVLRAYLQTHADAAVRVVNLDARTPTASFALPAARQHLAFAPGLPWFVLHGPDGKRLYKGDDVAKVVETMDKARAKR